ncbi:hypothetical protein EW146_g4432 [Bondarzewia mesenterica]|uniref:ATP phosphoribosyltransferase n=1 Tax=Bondarzewia mesenterica TaxID=1095465 RepID=A0A4S4LUK4_9AGAM|nr:hypothetical protein EW146_g4432 [Bondarzewia mesenterica]
MPEPCLDADTLNGRLLFAIPKKGRLHEKCLELLVGADIQFRRHNRLDVALVLNHPIALVFLPASDIPSFVGQGNVDLGITGHDVILEAQMEKYVTEELRLGFGKCALQVQVPESGPIQTVEDLSGKRVVTSFEVLSGEYFKEIDDRLQKADGEKTKIEYVGGSVEAACALGLADGIVDLVESGETMRAAGLHAIATVLQSEAVLIKSSVPKHSHLTPLINLITSRIAGVIAANKYVVCEYNILRDKLSAATAVTPGRRAPTISPLEDSDWVAVSAMVLKSEMARTMDRLVEVGAEDILIFNLDNCRVLISPRSKRRYPRLVNIACGNLVSGKDILKPISAELYKLNVYGPGSFLKAHKDTARSGNIFGSLVVTFPITHERGELILRHKKKKKVNDFTAWLRKSKESQGLRTQCSSALLSTDISTTELDPPLPSSTQTLVSNTKRRFERHRQAPRRPDLPTQRWHPRMWLRILVPNQDSAHYRFPEMTPEDRFSPSLHTLRQRCYDLAGVSPSSRPLIIAVYEIIDGRHRHNITETHRPRYRGCMVAIGKVQGMCVQEHVEWVKKPTNLNEYKTSKLEELNPKRLLPGSKQQ